MEGTKRSETYEKMGELLIEATEKMTDDEAWEFLEKAGRKVWGFWPSRPFQKWLEGERGQKIYQRKKEEMSKEKRFAAFGKVIDDMQEDDAYKLVIFAKELPAFDGFLQSKEFINWSINKVLKSN